MDNYIQSLNANHSSDTDDRTSMGRSNRTNDTLARSFQNLSFSRPGSAQRQRSRERENNQALLPSGTVIQGPSRGNSNTTTAGPSRQFSHGTVNLHRPEENHNHLSLTNFRQQNNYLQTLNNYNTGSDLGREFLQNFNNLRADVRGVGNEVVGVSS